MKDKRYVVLRRNKMTGVIQAYCPDYSKSGNHGYCDVTDKDARVYVIGSVYHNGRRMAQEGYEYYLKWGRWETVSKRDSSYPDKHQKANSANQLEWLNCRAMVKNGNKRFGDKYEYKAFRLGSKHCPIVVDYSELVDMKKGRVKSIKNRYSNIPIKEVIPEQW